MTAWETVGTGVTANTTSFAQTTGFTGQSTTVRNTQLGSKVNLEAIWGQNATTDTIRVRSPRLHDNVNGIRYANVAAQQYNMIGYRPQTPLVPQDLLVTEILGGAAEADSLYLQLSYASLPGSDGNYLSYPQVQARIVDIMTQPCTITAAATANNWSPGQALNATLDLMKANTWYALLGYTVNASGGAIAIQGPDTGGLKIGGPCTTAPLETREWFCWMDEFGEEPAIPVINSANKAGTFVYVGATAATYTGEIDLLFAELTGSTLS